MVPLATRTLLFDKIRLVIAVGGIAFAILLMLVLRGIMDGTVAKATAYVDHAGADVFLAQEGVEHFALSTSVIPSEVEAQAAAVPGVAAASGIVSVPLVIQIGDSEQAVRLVGFDPGAGLGGPWSLAAGTAEVGVDGAVIDSTLAREAGLRLGGTVELGGQSFVVRGLSNGTNALAGKIVFIQRDVAARVLGLQQAHSYVLVRASAGEDLDVMTARLDEAIPGVAVMTRAELSRNERDLLSSLFVTPVNVMATIGVLVGAMVVGLTIYTAAAERLRDFGVLKAIGASNRYIFGVIIRLGLLVGFIGFAAGLGAAYVAKPVIEHYVPDLGIEYRFGFVVLISAIAGVISLLSAVLPVYRIAGLDPKEVFKT